MKRRQVERTLSPTMAVLFRYRKVALAALQILLVCVSYALAFLLRFEWNFPEGYIGMFLATLPWLILFRLLAFAYFRLHRGWWRYVGMRDLVALVKAVTVSSLMFTAALVFLGHYGDGFPRSLVIIDAMLTVGLVGGVRFALRAARESRRPGRPKRTRRALIIGAGDAGELLLREMHNNPRLGYVPVGFLDDDKRKEGFQIHGVDVLGNTRRLSDVLTTTPADEIIIAIPSASRDEMQQLVNRCIETELPFKIVPAIAALSDGRVQVSQLRPVRVEDLLGREPVTLDADLIRADIAGRRVLITGAGGSIGSELARQIAGFSPACITLVERSENALYLVEQELRRRHPELDVRARICDVSDSADLDGAFRDARPQLVYHAAAFKHVPMMENHIRHAVFNNVFGTLHVARAAQGHGAKLVLISTDKAVAPCNVMGATKRLAERLVLSLNTNGDNHFVIVRFGNVLGSNGSVVPLFKEQIADGGPVTVTHPDATRYFMTIPEAVQLVLQAATLQEARNRIAMLEMGQPVKIVDLARNLIRLSGMEPDVEISIVYTGLRSGEKLHEQLTSDTEETLPTRSEKIRLVRTERPSVSARDLEVLQRAVEGRDDRAILRRLQELVPEYSPQTSLLGSVRDRGAESDKRELARTAG
ncbi:MAG: polysaccharide biosynthesis protein [Gemmatimonadaceae bacterium]